jgi:Mg2+-importing ATPase
VDVVAWFPAMWSSRVGDIVPAGMRLLEANELECDEAVLTGESLRSRNRLAHRGSLGSVDGNDVRRCRPRRRLRTGTDTAFGHIALGVVPRQAAFQVGLRDFSYLLVRVAGVLTVSIFIINVLLSRPVLEALLFSLAIAIGLTPQLLPAIVTVSLSTGSRRLAQRKVLVKRLVSIEDLGNITLLFTDKTGTLTDGRITFDRSIDGVGSASESASVHGLVCTEAVIGAHEVVSGNQLDVSLWQGAGDADRGGLESGRASLRGPRPPRGGRASSPRTRTPCGSS